MVWDHVLAHVILPSLVAFAAGFGAWRCGRLLRYAHDPRLVKLMWFYGLFAASLVSMAIWTGQLAAGIGEAVAEGHSAGLPHSGGGLHRAENINVFLLLHHILMLASLGVAVQAFSHRSTQDVAVPAIAIVPFAFFAPFIIVALALQVAMTLYLAVQAVLNHMERRNPGALQVAAGFLLFFIGHLGFFIFHQPGMARTPLGDAFALVGIVLLVRLLPKPLSRTSK